MAVWSIGAMPSFSNPNRAKTIVIFAIARLRWRKGVLGLRSGLLWVAENDLIFKAAVISLGIFSGAITAVAVLYL
ncbi:MULTISPECIES: hypothetical protein [unclassified Bradyrhizobium]